MKLREIGLWEAERRPALRRLSSNYLARKSPVRVELRKNSKVTGYSRFVILARAIKDRFSPVRVDLALDSSLTGVSRAEDRVQFLPVTFEFMLGLSLTLT